MTSTFNISNLPSVKKLRERDSFTAVASIPLRHWWQLDDASSWAESRWEEAGRKYRRRVKAGENLAWFEFESDEDTAEFLLRFG